MTAEKVSLSHEKETLLITLYGKGQEASLSDSLLHDRFAAEAIRRIDYDFSRLQVTRDLMIGLAIRAHIFDRWTRTFIDEHPRAVVLHLGCGLDSRVFRINPASCVRWFDVDYPEVIALRRRLYPRRKNYTLIGSSVTDPCWLADVPYDRPAMIIAEGLLPYVAESEVPRLLNRLTTHMPNGELIFDGYSRLGLRMLRSNPSIRATGASLHWSLDNPKDLEVDVPKLKLIAEELAYDPRGDERDQLARLSWPARVAVRVFAMVPTLGRMGRLLRYRF